MISLSHYFPTYLPEDVFIRQTCSVLKPFGFDANNTLPLVCICRDEICQSIFTHVSNQWGEAFNLSSLSAMFMAGNTALKAALSHAPEIDMRKRYLFYVFPHVAINNNQEIGRCARFGIANSTACGALICFHDELTSGKTSVLFDEHDIEMSIVKKRLLKLLPNNDIPDLLTLTKTVRASTQSELESALRQVINTSESDYAIITGIQIHAEDNNNYIAPDVSYIVINGIRHDIKIA